jgi:hypothetical protein
MGGLNQNRWAFPAHLFLRSALQIACILCTPSHYLSRINFAILVVCLLIVSPVKSQEPGKQRFNENKTANDKPVISLAISTWGEALDKPREQFKVGQEILVMIRMTDTSNQPESVCVSSALYQDVPRLTRNGQALSFASSLSSEMRNTQADDSCQKLNLPQNVRLKPDESTLVDWLTIVDDEASTGADAWYDPLPPGKYELSLQRRLDCCDGPRIESNQISFEVVR